jgi:hypothetical protein
MFSKEILVFGMRRSGNHAVIQWMLGLLSDRMPDVRDKCVVWRVLVNNQPLPLDRDPLPPYMGETPLDTQVVTFESRDVFFDLGLDATRRRLPSRKKLVILRDPFNWMASLRAIPHLWNGDESAFDEQVDLWTKYARTFFVERPDLARGVNFNEWFSSEDYRRELTGYLEEPFSDLGLNWINGPAQGGQGSSFNFAEYDGRAQEMDILGRWKALDDACRRKFDDKPELRELSSKIFNFCPF